MSPRLKALLRRFRRDERGSATIEAVIWLPMFVIFFVMIADVSLVFFRQTEVQSLYAPSELKVGRDDNCSDGGGSRLISLGGMKFAAHLAVFRSQLAAIKHIEFAARAEGIEDASMIAGGLISGT